MGNDYMVIAKVISELVSEVIKELENKKEDIEKIKKFFEDLICTLPVAMAKSNIEIINQYIDSNLFDKEEAINFLMSNRELMLGSFAKQITDNISNLGTK